MTIDIRITTLDPHGYGPEDEQLEAALAALGFVRQKPGYQMQRVLTGDALTDHNTMVEEMAKDENPAKIADELVAAGIGGTTPPAAPAPAPAPAPVRERGKPSPGHARRTKAEIAEDEAFLAGANKGVEIVSQTGVTADEIPLITSDPENRVGPQDSAADAEQDAADEAAETAAAKAADPKPTHEDIRNVLGIYQKAYGLPATMEDCPKVITEVCGAGKVKVSDVPEDKIADVVAALKAAGKANTFGRTLLVAS